MPMRVIDDVGKRVHANAAALGTSASAMMAANNDMIYVDDYTTPSNSSTFVSVAGLLFQLLRTAHGLYGERQWDSH